MVTYTSDMDDLVLETLGKDKFFYQAWMKYAQGVADTEDVYDFIVDKRIGADYASTYIKIAEYVEKKVHDLSKAESLLRKGKDYFIKQESQSMELVKIEKAYEDFGRRVRDNHTQKVTRMVRNITSEKDAIRPRQTYLQIEQTQKETEKLLLRDELLSRKDTFTQN